MKLKLFLIAASAMTLASCSSDEVVQSNENANAIKFSVVANNASRAADYWCNLNKPTEFQVWAKFDGKSYFGGDWFSDAAKTTYVEKDGTTRYWPQVATGKPIDFYAAKICAEPVGDAAGVAFATANWTDAGVLTLNYDMDAATGAKYTSSSAQHDLLYAYSQETAKPAEYGGTTALNFRHALSQIVFKAKNTNKKIHVQITEVKVGNAIKSGVFSYPTKPTTPNVEDHEQGGTYPNATTVGTWTNSGFATFTTGAPFTIEIPYDADNAVNLTDNKAGATPSTKESELANSFLLIPTATATTAWDTATASAENLVTKQTGSYFAFKTKIWNVNDSENGKQPTDVVVYDGYIYIPYSFNWMPGKKYIYTIDFTASGHGGFEDDGDEVLIPIKFTVKVDDFAAVTNTPVNGGNTGL